MASSLRTNYEKYLYPYELFQAKNGKLKVRLDATYFHIPLLRHSFVCGGGGGS